MRHLMAGLFMLMALPAFALDEAQIRKILEPKLNGVKIEAIQPAPVAGLLEVRFRTAEGMQIVYTDANAEHLIVGNVYDAKSDRNLTEERIRKLTAINFDSLPLNLAVKIQRGNGRRVLAMFADPYCPACQQFEKELAQVDDITLYVFMLPVIRPELADQSRAVWCASDRAKAWQDVALNRKRPVGNARCDNPVDKILELGKSLNLRSTPTLFLANGEKISGGLPAARLRSLLDDVAAKSAPAVK